MQNLYVRMGWQPTRMGWQPTRVGWLPPYTHALCLTLAAAVAIAALAAVEPADHVRNSQGLHTDRRR